MAAISRNGGARVLVTGVGSAPAVCVIRGLRQSPRVARVLGTDINPARAIAGSSFCDEFFQVPHGLDASFVPRLLEICSRHHINVLLPTIDEELRALARARELFNRIGTAVAVSEEAVLNLVMDKLAFPEWLQAQGFWAPQTRNASAFAREPSFAFPVFLKPRFGRASRAALKVDSLDHLRLLLPESNEFVVQEYLEGPEFTCDVLLDLNGRCIAVVPRRRLEVKAGVVFKAQTEANPELMRMAAAICEKAGLRYACNVQFIWAKDTFFCIELNPRFSGGLALTIAAGINLPELVVRLALGESIQPNQNKFATLYMARYWSEVFYPLTSERPA